MPPRNSVNAELDTMLWGGNNPLRVIVPASWTLITLLRPKDGPYRDHPLGGVHLMELGPTATGQPCAPGPENSHEPSSHPEKPVARSPA